jgi:hypothetical protein
MKLKLRKDGSTLLFKGQDEEQVLINLKLWMLADSDRACGLTIEPPTEWMVGDCSLQVRRNGSGWLLYDGQFPQEPDTFANWGELVDVFIGYANEYGKWMEV